MTYPTSVCSCSACIRMCERNPCWPTPDEARALITAGYGDRLMTDWWVDYPENIKLLCPASVGHEKSLALDFDGLFPPPEWHKGRCTFLSKEGKCELHDKGLKPLEGRVSDHATNDPSVREHIVALWKKEQNEFEFHG